MATSMLALYLITAVLAGGMLPLQSAINARLAGAVGGPVWAAAVSGVILTVVLILIASGTSRGGPRLNGLAVLPWWVWTGGLCGAALLSVSTALVRPLGAEQMIALIMTGQVLASIALDYFGVAGLAPQPLNARHSIAAALLIAGATLMR